MNAETGSYDRDSMVASLDCFPLRLPLKKPMQLGGFRFDSVGVLYVRVTSVSGAEGWGEAIADLGNAGETLRGMVGVIDARFRELTVGRTVHERLSVLADLNGGVFANGGAITAIDMALLDLAGKLRGAPVAEVLGGMHRRQVGKLAIVGGGNDKAALIDEVTQLLEDGVHAFKLKVGSLKVSEDIAMLAAVREAIGDDCFLAADANMAWDNAAALRFAKAAAEFGLDYLEQPVTADYQRMASLGRVSPVAISADEAIHDLNDILALYHLQAITGASLKSIKLSGITSMLRVAVVADGLGMPVGLAMMMESGLATAAMTHAACALPQVDWLLNPGSTFLADQPIRHEPWLEGGHLACPQGPGLGVQVDEKELERFLV
ncbi:MAG: enolase C-terminal domain-like protein [Tepidamorphaceae bacterium]